MDASSELAVGASRRVEGKLPSSAAGLVRSLSLAILLQWAGAGALLPLLPLYVRHRGGSDLVVGAVMAAYFAGAFVFQYGAGRLSDRLGRIPVLVGGVLVYALGSLLFLVPGPAVLDVIFRGLQGAGAGAAMVAALSMIARGVPLSHRGRATGMLYGAELGGLAVGPVLGSIAGLSAMRWLFGAAAVVAIASLVPVLFVRAPDITPGGEALVPTPMPAGPPAGPTGRAAMSRWRKWTGSWRERSVTGALLAAATIGLTSGVYEACWSLLMTRHGAAQWEIGVSWTLFALPFAAMSRPAGWLADHFDRRWLAIGSLAWCIGFLTTYPFLPGFVVLMVLGVWESLGFSVALPACQSLLGQGTSPERHGHAQGLFAASQTGASAVSAACAGALFGLAPWLPFVSGAAGCAVIMMAVALVWRRVPGRIPRQWTEASSPLVAGS